MSAQSRFVKLALNLVPNNPSCGGIALGWFVTLESLYLEPHRHYHTLNHIEFLLKRLDALKPFSEGEKFRPGFDRFLETEVAIWFHDAIYTFLAKDNEENSKRLCHSFLVSIGAERLDGGNFSNRVMEAISATKHDGSSAVGNAARLMADLDTSHFAIPWEDFDATNALIRKEYKIVPWEMYRWARIEILSQMLKRRKLFYLLEELEIPARANVKKHIEQLVSFPLG